MQTGKRIQAKREELGLNLGDIAQKVGVAVSTIQRYEKGKIEKIKLPVIEAIAKALAVDPAWLLGQTDCPTPAAQEPGHRQPASSAQDLPHPADWRHRLRDAHPCR